MAHISSFKTIQDFEHFVKNSVIGIGHVMTIRSCITEMITDGVIRVIGIDAISIEEYEALKGCFERKWPGIFVSDVSKKPDEVKKMKKYNNIKFDQTMFVTTTGTLCPGFKIQVLVSELSSGVDGLTFAKTFFSSQITPDGQQQPARFLVYKNLKSFIEEILPDIFKIQMQVG